MLAGFDSKIVTGEGTSIFVCSAGAGKPLLLLHGFPQTHLMWRDVAPRLVSGFTVVCADLRGYGASGCPPSSVDHAPYGKRAMAADMIAVMSKLGFARFSVAGHDRGGRVAYRMALDHPDRIEACAVLDVVPTGAAWKHADARMMLAFWPWNLLAQPAPLPESLIGGAAEAVIENAVAQWGSSAQAFSMEVKSAYEAQLRDPARLHAICEDYRAAAAVDRDHDAQDLVAGRLIQCPLLALWSADGGLASWYDDAGGPLALWRQMARDVRGGPVRGGHFFPEEYPEETAQALAAFFSSARSA